MINVLYVDDEEMLREISKAVLEEQSRDIHVTTFSNPKEAFNYLKHNRTDVIVSDYWMVPDDGISFLVKVRQWCDRIPFILFTGKSKEEVVIEALNEGADYYLQKGGDPKITYAQMEHMIRKAVEARANESTILNLKASLLVLPEEKKRD